jgi:hypothetical protein
MQEILYEKMEIFISEGNQEILINESKERFNYVSCENQHRVFHNATLSYDKSKECYIIEGEQTLTNEHRDSGFDYEALLCLHPAELIKAKSFLGIKYYKVSGTLTRQIKSRYVCKHKNYLIHQRSLISQSFTEDSDINKTVQ